MVDIEVIPIVVFSQGRYGHQSEGLDAKLRGYYDICVNKSVFTSYNIVKESKEQIFMDNSRPSPMIAKAKFSLNQS